MKSFLNLSQYVTVLLYKINTQHRCELRKGFVFKIYILKPAYFAIMATLNKFATGSE